AQARAYAPDLGGDLGRRVLDPAEAETREVRRQIGGDVDLARREAADQLADDQLPQAAAPLRLEDAHRAELVDAAVGLDPPEGDQPPALGRDHELLGGEVLVVGAETAHARDDRRRRARPRGDGAPRARVPVRGLRRRRSRRAAARAGAAAGRPGGAAAGRVSPRPATRAESLPGEAPWLWGMTRYQWLVLFAAWLGWGFDGFDALLFNLVAPVCLPRPLGVAAGDAGVGAAPGASTATLSVGSATGVSLFGLVLAP